MGNTEQIKALEKGNGVQYLVDAARKIFDNPIYMVDANYSLIAYSGGPVDDYIWNTVITTGTYSPEVLQFQAQENIMEDISNSDKIILLKRDGWKNSRLTAHVFNGDGIWVCQIMMYEENTPFDEETMAAFEALSDKISCEIRDYDYFRTLAMTYRENKIVELLDGTDKNPFIYNPHAQILYSGFDDYLYVAVAAIPSNNILDSVHRDRLAYFKSVLNAKYKSYKYSVYADYIVVLMSSKHRYFHGASFFSQNDRLFELNDLYIGISDSFESIYEMRTYYDHAVAALKNGMESNRGQRIFLYEDDN